MGVDLSRNFDYQFIGEEYINNTIANLSDMNYPCKHYYRGSEPFSEPETQALKAFLDDYHPQIVINLE